MLRELKFNLLSALCHHSLMSSYGCLASFFLLCGEVFGLCFKNSEMLPLSDSRGTQPKLWFQNLEIEVKLLRLQQELVWDRKEKERGSKDIGPSLHFFLLGNQNKPPK